MAFVMRRKLRSADAAFELLDSFSGIESRGTVAAAMLHKESDILAQFAREVRTQQPAAAR